MSKYANICLAILLLATSACSLIKPVKDPSAFSLTIQYSFAGTLDSNNYYCKTQVFIDDSLYIESIGHLQTSPAVIKTFVPAGRHAVRIINLAMYRGKWEEHLVKNNYSIDCLFENNINFESDRLITLVFDLYKGTLIK